MSQDEGSAPSTAPPQTTICAPLACSSEERPEAPADHLVRVIHALIEGLVLQRLLTPDLYPDEVFYSAFSVLAAATTPGEANR